MIRISTRKDLEQLSHLYSESLYEGLPAMVKWAVDEVPERMLVSEESGKIVAAVYTDVCVYNNLWAGYLVFRQVAAARRLVDHMVDVRNSRGLRNLYVLCPKQFTDVRLHLITRGFMPECLRTIQGIDYIVEYQDGSFKPDFKISNPNEDIPVNLRKGNSEDIKPLAQILHESLPTTLKSIDDARSCLERWVSEMQDYTIVADHENSPIGVVLLSLEMYPVLDKNTAMLCYIAVDERFRRRGVGEKLVNEACRVLSERGKRTLEVDVAAHDVQARVFYTKVGFYPFWYSKRYMPHDDGIFYRKDF